ncbi:hypothetical protein [Allomesorhizobium camelthorni]|uniref:Uncharacterized protein n=1 Tax=Allomesorhizobium camelthorni TaxID=475069 RepID=A0A6G4WHN0_9HYPH|nr:hypothetical protein [Mesorhizobium camelthorni]NGO54114.1 hypothetical protein [Mesorhizobium camelthorni]
MAMTGGKRSQNFQERSPLSRPKISVAEGKANAGGPIATRYHMTVEEIAFANYLTDGLRSGKS